MSGARLELFVDKRAYSLNVRTRVLTVAFAASQSHFLKAGDGI